MQHYPQQENNMPKAVALSSLVMAALVFVGFFIVFGSDVPHFGMGGIIVNYGTSEEGMGDDFMSVEEPSKDENANGVRPDRVVPTETPDPTPSRQVAEKVVATQDVEDAPAVAQPEKPTEKPAPETTKEVKKSTPTINTNALYKGRKNGGTGAGDGTGSIPGNQGSRQGDPAAANYGEGGSGFGDQPITLASRFWAIPPGIVFY